MRTSHAGLDSRPCGALIEVQLRMLIQDRVSISPAIYLKKVRIHV